MAIGLTHLGSRSDTSDLSEYTFAGESLGSPTPSRMIVVAVFARTTGSISTVDSATISGVAATIIVSQDSLDGGDRHTGVTLLLAAVPSGSSGDIVVTFAGGQLRCAISWYGITGASSNAHDTDTAIGLIQLSCDTREDGAAIAASAIRAASSASWSGITKNFETVVESFLTVTSAGALTASDASGSNFECLWDPDTADAPGIVASFAPEEDDPRSVFESRVFRSPVFHSPVFGGA